MNYRYQLEGSRGDRKRKADCPYCGGKRVFTRYIDYESGDYLADWVGMCDRSNKCGHHYKPKDYFARHPERKQHSRPEYRKEPVADEPLTHIPPSVLIGTLNDYTFNSFLKPLTKLYPIHMIEKGVSDYYLGTTTAHFSTEAADTKPAVFWFIDKNNNIRAGQVKLFTKECSTAKYITDWGEKRNCQTWMHTLHEKRQKASRELVPEWLEKYKRGKMVTCLFGEHLLSKYPNKPVALVEAPKTAFIASIVYPEFVWLATSSLTYLTKERCMVLAGRKVVLFPDCGIPNLKTGKTCLDFWRDRVEEFKHIAQFTFSTFLEDKASNAEKEAGLDLADLLLRDLRRKPININLDDISAVPVDTRTGKDFGYLVMAFIQMKDGSQYDVLYDKDAENLVVSHPKIGELAAYFEKTFLPGKLNGINCLINIAQG